MNIQSYGMLQGLGRTTILINILPYFVDCFESEAVALSAHSSDSL